MTAVVAAPVRVPGQAGPPAVEQTDADRRERWRLVDAAQVGDMDAFAELYRLYHPAVFRFVFYRCGHRQLAEDLAGDTFVKALRNITGITWQGRDPGAWFVTIARNLVADYFKSGRYRLESAVDVAEYSEQRVDHSPEGNPERLVTNHLTNITLLTAMRQLTAEQRECLTLRFLQGLSVTETAAAMDKQEGAVKALQHRANRALARLLPADFNSPEVPR